MSDFHFGVDDYDLNYHPSEAGDGMGGVDWDKVEFVEIEGDVYVRERECENIAYEPSVNFECSECGCSVYGGDELGANIENGRWNFCPNCARKVGR